MRRTSLPREFWCLLLGLSLLERIPHQFSSLFHRQYSPFPTGPKVRQKADHFDLDNSSEFLWCNEVKHKEEWLKQGEPNRTPKRPFVRPKRLHSNFQLWHKRKSKSRLRWQKRKSREAQTPIECESASSWFRDFLSPDVLTSFFFSANFLRFEKFFRCVKRFLKFVEALFLAAQIDVLAFDEFLFWRVKIDFEATKIRQRNNFFFWLRNWTYFLWGILKHFQFRNGGSVSFGKIFPSRNFFICPFTSKSEVKDRKIWKINGLKKWILAGF